MTTYRYIFRARNPEQGVQFVTVEHDQANDTDGALSKVVARFRMRDREFVQHFATQKVINADTIEVKFAAPCANWEEHQRWNKQRIGMYKNWPVAE